MAELDPISIVEAGYRWIEDEQAWLAQVAEAAAPFSPHGVGAYIVSLANAPRVRAFCGHDTPLEFEDSIRTFSTALSRRIAREMYAPTEFVGNARFRLARIARSHPRGVRELARIQAPAAWALVGGDTRRDVITLTFPAPTRRLASSQPFTHARTLGLVAAHLGAALRLRTLVAPMRDEDDATEAVLSPRGKVLHATHGARTLRAREALVEAVARSERARGTMRRQAPAKAIETWSALVGGQWSIVDFVDRDGKRIVLARRNPLDGRDLLGLTREERSVAWLAAAGHSNKYIAYELGISMGKVTRRLTTALRKMQLASRRDLLRTFGVAERSK